MKFAGSLIFIALIVLTGYGQSLPCLPADTDMSAKVAPGNGSSQTRTVSQTLKAVKARCTRGKLVDRKRREIRFFELQGCWGNPPTDYLEILENQKKEVASLKKKYTLIELTCDKRGPPQLVL